MDTPDNNPQILALGLLLLNDGTLKVVPGWDEDKYNVEKTFGDFLHQLISKKAMGAVLNQLITYSQDDLVKEKFIKKVIQHYTEKEEEYKSTPIISPLEALKIDNIIKKQ